MFCVNCGTANEDGVKFCVNCGKPMEETTGPAPKPVKEKKPVNKKALIIGIVSSVVVLAALIIGGMLLNNAASTIDLNQYITVDAYGYDGYGNLGYSIDWNAIEEKYGKKISYTSKAKKEFGVLLNLATPSDDLAGYISVKFEKSDHLANGDMVEYDFVVNEQAQEYLNFKVKHKPAKYMVSGLNKVESFDPFESLVLSFAGVSGQGTCEIDYSQSGSFVQNYYYDFGADKTYNLSNGDTVKVSLYSAEPEQYINRYGKLPTVTEKEYTVNELAEYITALKDLKDSTKQILSSAANDIVTSYIKSSYENTSSLSDYKYEGCLLSVRKSFDNVNTHNCLTFVYSGTVVSSAGNFRDHKVYFPVTLSNVCIYGDGTAEYNYSHKPGGSSDLGDSWYSTAGYTYLSNFYKDIESTYKDYNLEYGDGLAQSASVEKIEKLADIPDTFKTNISAAVKAQIEAYISKNYGEDLTVSELAPAGEFLLVKESDKIKEANKYYVVYSGIIHNNKGDYEDLTVYYPVEVYGLEKYSTGECLYYDINQTIKGYTSFPKSWSGTYGYLDGAVMYKEIVTDNASNYSVDVSDSFKKFDPDYDGSETSEGSAEGNTEGGTVGNSEGNTEAGTEGNTEAGTEGNTENKTENNTEGNKNP